jgi:hypothetical protein
MTNPARITIELEAPPHPRGRWRARTRVDGRLAHHDFTSARGQVDAAPGVPSIEVLEMIESREPAVIPTAYEPAAYQPAECTCIDGWCDTDHAND